jgi:hypothetical protein
VNLMTLEICSNIMASEQFDEEESLQMMIPACARLTLVSAAQKGVLSLDRLQKLVDIFNYEQYPMQLSSEIEAHSDLAIMKSLISNFDKWRRVECNSYELEDIIPHKCFAWNLLYWQCAANPPDPACVTFVLENCFEQVVDDSDDAMYEVSGLEADFALLLHYVVLRQIARYEVIANGNTVSQSERLGAEQTTEIRSMSWQHSLKRKSILSVRALVFPLLFLTAVSHILLNVIIVMLLNSMLSYWMDERMFSKFAHTGHLQPTKKERSKLAQQWRNTCSGRNPQKSIF